MSARIEKKMLDKGYVKVKGMAILNDVAVTETQHHVLSPTLSTKKAVEVFNDEVGDGWTLYRKKPESTSLSF